MKPPHSQDLQLTAIIPLHTTIGPAGDIHNVIDEALKMNIHVILVLDCHSQGVSDSFKSKLFSDFPTLKIVEGNFGNPGSARNAALTLVKTELVTFWDSDDFPEVRNIIKASKILLNSDRQAIICRFTKRDVTQTASRNALSGYSLGHTTNLIRFTNEVGLWRVIFKYNRIKGKKFPSLKMGEDQLFLISLKLSKTELIFSELETYHYQSHTFGQLTKSPKTRESIVQSFRYLVNSRLWKNQTLVSYMICIKFSFSTIKYAGLRNFLKVLYRFAISSRKIV